MDVDESQVRGRYSTRAVSLYTLEKRERNEMKRGFQRGVPVVRWARYNLGPLRKGLLLGGNASVFWVGSVRVGGGLRRAEQRDDKDVLVRVQDLLIGQHTDSHTQASHPLIADEGALSFVARGASSPRV